jgi:hypothetical protein
MDGAFHEAAHAVIAIRLGLNVPYITIQDNDRYVGHTITEYECEDRDLLSWIEKDATVDLVGVCVSKDMGDCISDFVSAREKLRFYVPATSGVIPICDYDFHEGRVSEELFQEEFAKYDWDDRLYRRVMRRCQKRADKLVKQNTAAINKVAGRLMTVGSLNGDKLRRIIFFDSEQEKAA